MRPAFADKTCGQINAIFKGMLKGLPLLLSQECYEACLADNRCGRWIRCSHSRGCDEMGTFMDSFPTGGLSAEHC